MWCLTNLLYLWATLDPRDHSNIRTSHKLKLIVPCCTWSHQLVPANPFCSVKTSVAAGKPYWLKRVKWWIWSRLFIVYNHLTNFLYIYLFTRHLTLCCSLLKYFDTYNAMLWDNIPFCIDVSYCNSYIYVSYCLWVSQNNLKSIV